MPNILTGSDSKTNLNTPDFGLEISDELYVPSTSPANETSVVTTLTPVSTTDNRDTEMTTSPDTQDEEIPGIPEVPNIPEYPAIDDMTDHLMDYAYSGGVSWSMDDDDFEPRKDSDSSDDDSASFGGSNEQQGRCFPMEIFSIIL